MIPDLEKAGDIAWTLHEAVRMIMGRRSIRKFKDRPVEPDKVQVILECALAAPSSKDRRPCHLIMIDDRGILDSLAAAVHEMRPLENAPLAIAVCVDVKHYEETYNVTDGTWIEDSAACMENILLCAKALGLGSLWIKILNRPERIRVLAPYLDLPEGVCAFAMAAIGYPDEFKPPRGGIDEAKLHHNRWNCKA